jgi:hypothetical protein
MVVARFECTEALFLPCPGEMRCEKKEEERRKALRQGFYIIGSEVISYVKSLSNHAIRSDNILDRRGH